MRNAWDGKEKTGKKEGLWTKGKDTGATKL